MSKRKAKSTLKVPRIKINQNKIMASTVVDITKLVRPGVLFIDVHVVQDGRQIGTFRMTRR